MKVGLEVLLAENHWLRRAPRYTEIRDLALQAEAMGFDSLWLYDHLLYRDAEGRPHGIWECWTMLSALAEATEHAEIGSLVACTAFRNPALLAKMAATLDVTKGVDEGLPDEQAGGPVRRSIHWFSPSSCTSMVGTSSQLAVSKSGGPLYGASWRGFGSRKPRGKRSYAGTACRVTYPLSWWS